MLQAQQLELFFGTTAILDGVDLAIERGERVCLVGRNGTGKSTLLKVLAGEVAVDSGEIRHQGSLRVARLEQSLPAREPKPVYTVVAEGLGAAGRAVAEYHRLIHEAPDDLDALARAQACGIAGQLITQAEARMNDLREFSEAAKREARMLCYHVAPVVTRRGAARRGAAGRIVTRPPCRFCGRLQQLRETAGPSQAEVAEWAFSFS